MCWLWVVCFSRFSRQHDLPFLAVPRSPATSVSGHLKDVLTKPSPVVFLGTGTLI